MAKFGGNKIGGFLSTRMPKFKLFNHSCLAFEIFRVGKREKKIKFNKIWVTKMNGSPSNKDAKIQTF